MTVTHPSAVRNSVTDYIVGQLDEGAPAPGTLVFLTSGDAEVATLAFSIPAFNPASSGTATANPITPDASATGGVIARARMKNSAGIDKIICSVSAPGGGGDIILNSVTIAAGQQVSLTSLTYTAPI